MLLQSQLQQSLDRKPRIAVILHLYYQDLWDEFADDLENLHEHEFDLFVTLTKGAAHTDQARWITDKILSSFPLAVIINLRNKGTDNGPFIMCLNSIFHLEKQYDYVLKLHTKKSLVSSQTPLAKVWRQELMAPIIGSTQAVNNCLLLFENDKSIGMIGAKKHITDHQSTNQNIIAEYMKLLGMRKHGLFVGGNMFWIRFAILQKYMTGIDLLAMYDKLEAGYVTDARAGTRTHSLERIWGYCVTNSGHKIYGVK